MAHCQGAISESLQRLLIEYFLFRSVDLYLVHLRLADFPPLVDLDSASCNSRLGQEKSILRFPKDAALVRGVHNDRLFGLKSILCDPLVAILLEFTLDCRPRDLERSLLVLRVLHRRIECSHEDG